MEIDKIFVHCSATKPGMDIGVAEIREWHIKKGWKDIGYHYVIRRDGSLENGRREGSIGAHVYGYNKGSIGICLVGGIDDLGKPDANFTFEQYNTLDYLIGHLQDKYANKLKVLGHRDVADKACPSFSIQGFLENAK